jgi:hypothetical protein
MFRDFGRDLRFAVRALTAAPGFSLGVIGSLVLGIVANITAFSFLNAAVFRPFPGVRHQHELVAVHVARAERFGTAGHADLSTTQRYMHLSPAATEDAIRLLDGRQSGLETVEKFGDILDTREAASGSTCERGI